jgi:hypothetical protein
MFSQGPNHEFYDILLNNHETESENESFKNSTLAVSKNEDVRVFTCNISTCQRVYKSKCRLEKHVASHFYENVFKCSYGNCTKIYKSKENLILHIKNKHLGFKPYICSFCVKRFSHRNGRIYHEKKMHGEMINLKCISRINLI